jgi:hypothetical protein
VPVDSPGNTNLSVEINRLYDRRGAVWGSRYKAILVSQEEAARAGRFRYILAHGLKEGLVAQARDWPGVHSVREIPAGDPIRGYWFDRTQEYAALPWLTFRTLPPVIGSSVPGQKAR